MSERPPIPYIGITGVTKKEEAETLLACMPNNSRRKVMIGVLASEKTIRGEKNKWPNRYPGPESLTGIFTDHTLALNLIHYNDKLPTLCDQMIKVMRLAGPHFHGFQLNIAWPSRGALKEYREQFPDKVIVLQIGSRALKMVDNSPQKLAEAVWPYADVIDYLLLDPSGGYGKPFDPAVARSYLETLYALDLSLGFGVAGGLGPSTLYLISALAEDFNSLCIDAEDRLRDTEDKLVLRWACDYLSGALCLFSGQEDI